MLVHMARVLVTGATGFIGRQCLQPLQELGYEVHALYRSVPLKVPGLMWHQTDLLSEPEPSILSEVRPSHLLHFAWYVHPKDYKTSPENERWRDATLALLKAFRKNGGVRAALAGTCMEYAAAESFESLDEDSPVGETQLYGKVKNETRIMCEKFSRDSGISFAWGRIFNLYGPYEAPARLVPQIIRSLLQDKSPTIPTGGLVRDYSHVKDIAGGFLALLESDVRGTVNIASGVPITLKGMAQAVADILDKQELVIDISDALSDKEPEKVVADVTRLTKEVNFVPRYTLRSGLEETIGWWRSAGNQLLQ
jgi:nucleoside-diphosphate-sugar epimerase